MWWSHSNLNTICTDNSIKYKEYNSYKLKTVKKENYSFLILTQTKFILKI